MAKTSLLNIQGEQVGEIELNDAIFGIEANTQAMHTLVVNYLANQRQGTQSTKTRTEVRGGGRKPWKQKGTGRARQGSTRSPQWTGGGVALGPKPRSYRFAVNKKLRRLAMKSAFSTKLSASEIVVLDNLDLDSYKTKDFVKVLSNLNVCNALIVTANKNDNVVRAAGNIKNIKTTIVTTLNVYDILKYNKFIVTKEAIEKIEEVYAK